MIATSLFPRASPFTMPRRTQMPESNSEDLESAGSDGIDETPIAAALGDDDIRHVAFKQIRDQFWYGMYGTFMIIIVILTGFINATHLC